MTYITPTSTTPIPGGLTFNQFIQTVLVGISGLPASLVRPSWQVAPPKQPDLSVNWLAFAIQHLDNDANGWGGMDDSGNYHSQRHEEFLIACSFYGPDCIENAHILRDGFQIPWNLQALTAADMGLVCTNRISHMPDLVHERWIDRAILEVQMRREIQRVYAIPSLLSAQGTIHTVLADGEYTFSWQAPSGG